MARFIVLRNCPPEAAHYEGLWLWFELPAEATGLSVADLHDKDGRVRFRPTGRFESRGHIEEAEIWEPESTPPLSPARLQPPEAAQG
jgi:hypothetical protein